MSLINSLFFIKPPNRYSSSLVENELLNKSLNRPKDIHVKSAQIKSEASIANKTTVVEEMKMAENKDSIISEEVLQYNLPHRLSYQNNYTRSKLDSDVKVISGGRELTQGSKLLSAERNPTIDIIRRRSLSLSDIDANGSLHRVDSTYVNHLKLATAAKLDKKCSDDAVKEEKALSQNPLRTLGRFLVIVSIITNLLGFLIFLQHIAYYKPLDGDHEVFCPSEDELQTARQIWKTDPHFVEGKEENRIKEIMKICNPCPEHGF